MLIITVPQFLKRLQRIITMILIFVQVTTSQDGRTRVWHEFIIERALVTSPKPDVPLLLSSARLESFSDAVNGQTDVSGSTAIAAEDTAAAVAVADGDSSVGDGDGGDSSRSGSSDGSSSSSGVPTQSIAEGLDPESTGEERDDGG